MRLEQSEQRSEISFPFGKRRTHERVDPLIIQLLLRGKEKVNYFFVSVTSE